MSLDFTLVLTCLLCLLHFMHHLYLTFVPHPGVLIEVCINPSLYMIISNFDPCDIVPGRRISVPNYFISSFV